MPPKQRKPTSRQLPQATKAQSPPARSALPKRLDLAKPSASRRKGARVKQSPRSPRPPALNSSEVRTLRELFWQNVLREMMSGLIVASMKLHAHDTGSGEGEVPTAQERSLLDGRVGLITRRGERIPVASIFPVFAATSGESPHQRAMSAAVEGTVLQVVTPAGEVYALPLGDIRGFHALSEDLIKQLEGPEDENHNTPFGFAAFTSLARTAGREVNDSPGAVHQGAD